MTCGPGTVAMAFDVTNPEAVRWAETRAAQLVTGVTDDVRDAIRLFVTRGFEEGIPPARLATLIRDGIGLTPRDAGAVLNRRAKLLAEGVSRDVVEKRAAAYSEKLLRRRALTIARTETMRASNEGTAQLWQQAKDAGLLTGREKKTWIVADPCPICAPYADEVVGIDEEFSAGQDPPLHPNCVLPGSLISGRVVAGLRSLYNGPAWEIETAKGHKLRLTGQHPVLTTEGWITASSLRQGMQVLSQSVDVSAISSTDDYQCPALVEDIFETLREQGLSTVQVSGLDLHGDARWTDGQIDVVGAERHQREDSIPQHSERLAQLDFVSSAVEQPLGVRLRSSDLSFKGVSVPSSASPRAPALSDDGSAVLLEARPLQPLLFGLASQWDVILEEAARQDVTVNAGFILELQKRGAGQVTLDEIVKIRNFDYFGHVYDIQSDLGWIISQNIVISNCRCTVGLVP